MPRMFGPVDGQPDVIGNAKVLVNPAVASVTTVSSTSSAPTTTTTTISVGTQIVSESFSSSAITLRGTQPSDNQVWWTIKLRDSLGRLSTSAGGQLCPSSSNYPFGPFCTGATFGRSGTAYEATYQGLFWISPDAPGGDWIPRFDPIPGGATVTGMQRLRITAK